MLVYHMPWFLFDCFVNIWFTPPPAPPSKKIARTPMIKEFKVPPREKTFLVAENCLTYICTPDYSKSLDFKSGWVPLMSITRVWAEVLKPTKPWRGIILSMHGNEVSLLKPMDNWNVGWATFYGEKKSNWPPGVVLFTEHQKKQPSIKKLKLPTYWSAKAMHTVSRELCQT